MNSTPEDQEKKSQISAYRRMLENVRELMGDKRVQTLEHRLEIARDKALELGELSMEEAEKISGYLKKDLEDATHFLASSEHPLTQWLRIDLSLVEKHIFDLLSQVADKTQVELTSLEIGAREAVTWHTGEITAIGTLKCSGCGQSMKFKQPGHIPPCPRCHNSVFTR